MNTLIPGAPLRSLSPTSNEYQRVEGVSRAAKPARVARFTLDAPEHSGTIPGARGDILTPGVALTSNLAVIFTLNQHTCSVAPALCPSCSPAIRSLLASLWDSNAFKRTHSTSTHRGCRGPIIITTGTQPV